MDTERTSIHCFTPEIPETLRTGPHWDSAHGAQAGSLMCLAGTHITHAATCCLWGYSLAGRWSRSGGIKPEHFNMGFGYPKRVLTSTSNSPTSYHYLSLSILIYSIIVIFSVVHNNVCMFLFLAFSHNIIFVYVFPVILCNYQGQ